MPRKIYDGDLPIYTNKYLHIGRAFSGHYMEDDCECIQAACGLVLSTRSGIFNTDGCEQHDYVYSKTMRQIHSGELCPASPSAQLASKKFRPMKKPFLDVKLAKRLLMSMKNTRDFALNLFDSDAVEAMRSMADACGLVPIEFTPVRHRGLYEHEFLATSSDPARCRWCSKPQDAEIHGTSAQPSQPDTPAPPVTHKKSIGVTIDGIAFDSLNGDQKRVLQDMMEEFVDRQMRP